MLRSEPAFTTGRAFTVTTVAAEAILWHPLELVTLTVKLPDELTFILCDVAPVDHK